MPKLLERLKSQIQATGKSESSAFAIATSALQKRGHLKQGTQELTAEGKARQALGNAGRAKDREAKYSGGKHQPSDYKYNPKTNAATLKKGK
jgi:hypothetical protein